MRTMNVHEAKAKFSELLSATEGGETVVICRRNVPIAEVRAVRQQPKTPRQLGLGPTAPGYELGPAFWLALPQDLVAAFSGDGAAGIL